MRKFSLLLAVMFVSVLTGYGQQTWIIDNTHSTVEFQVSHLTVSSVTGYFTSFSGSVVTAKKNTFEGAKVNTTIQVASITTNNLERDRHLKDDDFFNAAKYPIITFQSTSFKRYEDGSYVLTGDLTIRDVTKSIDLDVNFGGIVSIDNLKKAGFTATGRINRFDYGLKWDDSLDNGGLIVGEKVDIILNMELVQR